jgi:hypothetical protein
MLAKLDSYITVRTARIAAFVVLAIFLLSRIGWIIFLHGGVDALHQPLGGDFIIFYSTSELTLHGQFVQAFDPATLLKIQRALFPHTTAGMNWCYPPPFQLIIGPLALLPYALALAVWVGVTATLFVLMIQSIVPGRLSLLMTAAFPGLWIAYDAGQNGFLTAALLGFGLTQLEKRPWLAGALLGLLVYKPQFGVLLPLVLLGTGRWRSVIAAALSGTAFIAISAVVLGLGPWIEFFRTLPIVSGELAAGQLPFAKIPSVFAALRWLGAPLGAAYAVQGVVTITVAGATLWAWRRPAPLDLKIALLVPAMFLVTPYSFNYDLVILGIPIALIARYGAGHPLPVGTKTILALTACTPFLFVGLADATHIQMMAPALLICFGWFLMILRRAPAEVSRDPGPGAVLA